MRSVIAGQVDHTVILGYAGYGNHLTVESSGVILPSYGAPASYRYYGGIYVPASVIGASVTNHGSIGATYGYGYNEGGHGGVGVKFATSGHLTNTGSIVGGTGGPGFYVDGPGGIGVFFGGTGQVVNSGTILGGNGGPSSNEGYGGTQGGVGIVFSAGASLANSGTISGGSGGGNYNGGAGGNGIDLSGSGHLSNTGTISGGGAPSTQYHPYAAGNGVDLSGGASLLNDGVVLGGAGGSASSSRPDHYERGGYGGVGVDVAAASRLTNDGVITAGAGGSSLTNGGRGGDGVSVTIGGVVTNFGTITGGAGGDGPTGRFGAGYGGEGAYLNGGTLVNAGLIVGGEVGAGGHGKYAAGFAVRFGPAASTLVVDPGAAFAGGIAAYRFADDTLNLAGTAPGSLSGFGTRITDFTTITEDAHAHWTLGGSITGTGSIQIGTGATLALRGAVSVPTIAFLGGGGETLKLGTPGQVTSTLQGFAAGDVVDAETVHATSLRYAGGTLTLYDGQSVVDTLTLLGKYAQSDFSLKADGHGGTNVVFSNTSLTEPIRTLLGHLPASIPWERAV